MSEKQSELSVFEAPTFKKAFKKLAHGEQIVVEDEIDKIIESPDIGTQKKGDLSHLWVHKFILNNQQVLLGYTWKEDVLELYLLNIGPHENFYKSAKSRRTADLKFIG